jgi:hypothetical protein
MVACYPVLSQSPVLICQQVVTFQLVLEMHLMTLAPANLLLSLLIQMIQREQRNLWTNQAYVVLMIPSVEEEVEEQAVQMVKRHPQKG